MTEPTDGYQGLVAWLRKPLHPNAPTLAFHDAADAIDALRARLATAEERIDALLARGEAAEAENETLRGRLATLEPGWLHRHGLALRERPS